jgi:hypothetical protein
MAITTLDGAISGVQPRVPYIKTGITMAAVGAMRAYNPRYASGNPGPATAPAAGINGTAVTGPGTQFSRTNPGTGNAYVMGLDMCPSATGTLWLIDRLWENSALSVTSTTAQAITAAGLPARDRTGTINGVDVMAAIEWSATGGAGTPAITLTYTDQTGATGKTATFTGVTTPPVGTFEIFTPSAASGGVRAPTSLIQSATRTSGTMHLVLFRVLASLPCSLANVGAASDFLTGGAQRVFDGSCLEPIWIPSATAAVNFFGGYAETQG